MLLCIHAKGGHAVEMGAWPFKRRRGLGVGAWLYADVGGASVERRGFWRLGRGLWVGVAYWGRK